MLKLWQNQRIRLDYSDHWLANLRGLKNSFCWKIQLDPGLKVVFHTRAFDWNWLGFYSNSTKEMHFRFEKFRHVENRLKSTASFPRRQMVTSWNFAFKLSASLFIPVVINRVCVRVCVCVFTVVKNNQFLKKWIMRMIWNLHNYHDQIDVLLHYIGTDTILWPCSITYTHCLNTIDNVFLAQLSVNIYAGVRCFVHWKHYIKL